MGKISNLKRNFIEKQEQDILKKLVNQLEMAIELKDAGKDKEADVMVNDMIKWLEKKTDEDFSHFENTDNDIYDRRLFPINGEVIYESDNMVLVVIKEDEREKYLAVSYEYSYIKTAFDEEQFRNNMWNDFMSDNSFVCSIYEKSTNEYIGYCSVKDLLKDDWELAIELLPDKCNMGYGTEALNAFMHKVNELTGKRYFRTRVELDNHASQRLMKKLGGMPDGIGEFLLHGDEITKFQEEYKYLITDEIRAVAEEFCMDAEDILGYVLEYRFDIEKCG